MAKGMWHRSAVLTRSWSVALVLAIFGLIVSGVLLSEPARAVASLLCIALLIQSWITQRRYARTHERLAFLTVALSLPALASIWLGLNVLRFYSNSADSPTQIYSTVVHLQGIVLEMCICCGLSCWPGVSLSSGAQLRNEHPRDSRATGRRGGTDDSRELGSGLVRSALPFPP